jgi:hypothetical protein
MSDIHSEITKTLKEIASLDKKRETLAAKVKSLRAHRTIACASCPESHKICDLEVVFTHFYISN